VHRVLVEYIDHQLGAVEYIGYS